MGWLLIQIIRFYKFAISPMLGNNCRFYPTCSEYFVLAIRKHGTVRGSLMGIGRILRCHPFRRGGVDFP
ncbi:membrane protein insertion efficiency factor YidD [bacterium]|nr:membrane protein insertion efficiency factor YidD [bacterium]